MYAKILIVEDDVDECELLEETFKENGCDEVASFNNAFSFISYLKEEKTELPKVVILDYNMPQISGFQLLAFLKHNEKFSKISVIIYSGYDDDEFKIRCFKAGAVDFVKKLNTEEKLNEFILKVKDFAETGVYHK